MKTVSSSVADALTRAPLGQLARDLPDLARRGVEGQSILRDPHRTLSCVAGPHADYNALKPRRCASGRGRRGSSWANREVVA